MITIKLTKLETDAVEAALRAYIPECANSGGDLLNAVEALVRLTKARWLTEDGVEERKFDPLRVEYTITGQCVFRGVTFPREIDSAKLANIVTLSMCGKGIQAIKLYRQFTGAGLKETVDLLSSVGLWG